MKKTIIKDIQCSPYKDGERMMIIAIGSDKEKIETTGNRFINACCDWRGERQNYTAEENYKEGLKIARKLGYVLEGEL